MSEIEHCHDQQVNWDCDGFASLSCLHVVTCMSSIRLYPFRPIALFSHVSTVDCYCTDICLFRRKIV